VDYILVPSEHTKKAIFNTFAEVYGKISKEIIEKVKIIPHGVDHNLFYPKEKPKDKFRFIANKGFRNLEDRGGIQYLIKAYLEEFTSKDNVELLIKLNPAYGIPDIQQMIKKLAPRDHDLPSIKLNINSIRYNEMIDIYNLGHVFVSPTRAEAFNIPCIEAMSCGLPCITTDFGGQTDYVNDDNGWLISGQRMPVMHDLMYEGVEWLTPDIKQLKLCMRYCYEHPKEIEIKSKKALEKAKEYDWVKSAKLIMDIYKGGSNG
jgi:hypothetical protein